MRMRRVWLRILETVRIRVNDAHRKFAKWLCTSYCVTRKNKKKKKQKKKKKERKNQAKHKKRKEKKNKITHQRKPRKPKQSNRKSASSFHLSLCLWSKATPAKVGLRQLDEPAMQRAVSE